MILQEKYISLAENTKAPDITKTELSNDAYAICEFIEKLVNKIEHARLSMGNK